MQETRKEDKRVLGNHETDAEEEQVMQEDTHDILLYVK